MPSQPNGVGPAEPVRLRQRDPTQLLLFIGTGWPGQISEHNGLSADSLVADLARRGYSIHRIHSVDEVYRCLQERPVGAAVIDLDFTGGSLFRVYELLQSAQPPVPTLLMGSPAFHGQSLQPKALGRYDEYVRVDDTCTLEYLNLHLRGLLLRIYPDWEGPSAAMDEKNTPADQEEAAGELVCVFSAKGGTGKTTIATNLAVGLTELRNHRAALVDGDLYFGDVDIVLNVQPTKENPRRSLNDVATMLGLPDGDWSRAPRRALASVDQKVVDQILFRHPSGVRVLLAPPRPETVERIPHALMRRAIDVCRSAYDFTIVDMPSSYSEAEIELMDAANRIIVVLKPEMSSLRNTALYLEYAESFGWRDKLVFVLNRADSGRFTKISREDVEKHLGRATIPIISSGIIPQAVSEGCVVVTRYRGTKVAQGFEQVLDRVEGRDEAVECPPKPKRRFLGLLGRRVPVRVAR